MRSRSNRTVRSLGYTIVEALVSSSILLIGISAAASMSLTLLTQEEINERSVKVFNYLDNAARLYQLGVPASRIEALLPEEPTVRSMTGNTRTVAVAGLGNVDIRTLTVTYHPSGATAPNDSSEEDWTGGNKDTTRSASVHLLQADSFVPDDLPRVRTFGP